MTVRTESLGQANARALQGGGPERIERQHAQGKMTARERLDVLLDAGSFVELDRLRAPEGGTPGDGVITGQGTIEGRQVFVYAQDFTVQGGSVSTVHGEKIAKTMDLARQVGAPIIALADSGGARLQDGVAALAASAGVMLRTTQLSGVVPQIACVLGPCAGGSVYAHAMADFVFMVEGVSSMFVTGPELTRRVTHEDVTRDSLGGARMHAERSGTAHVLAKDERQCLERVRELVGYLPSNNASDAPPALDGDEPLRHTPELSLLIPESSSKAYDVKQVVRAIADHGRFFEVAERFARNIVVGLVRIAGNTVGIVANQPNHLAGCIDSHACVKAARFVRFCDAFNLPVVTLVDAPGFLPGLAQEHGGLVRHGAQLAYAYAEATVPKVTVVLRKAYGAAYVVMGSKQLRTDLNYALPNAEIAVAGAEGAIDIVFKAELAGATDVEATRKRLMREYREEHAHPYRAAQLGEVDEVIEPELVRPRIASALELLRDKRQSNMPRKHGNLPL